MQSMWTRWLCCLFVFQAVNSAAAQSERSDASTASVSVGGSGHLEKVAIKSVPIMRRGELQAPLLLEERVGIADQAQDEARIAGSTDQQGVLKDTRRQERQAVKTWKFRGPKPFPILHDWRLSDKEKEKELERVMEKLHLEFFVKKDLGHSRLPQARANFYAAATAYAHLTGRDHPEHFHFEELPELEKGSAELQDDGESDIDLTSEATADNVVLVPENKPECLSACEISGASCVGDAKLWTSEHSCICLRGWQKCSLETCSQKQREVDGFFTALNTREAEVCAWPKGKVFQHLHTARLDRKPDSTTGSIDLEDDPGIENDLLESSASSGVSLQPLLDTSDIKPAGATNPPAGCNVMHPEMLGDGNCDGGSYNTALCNWDGGDCCDTDCRPALHRCGVGGYQCLGSRKGVRVLSSFKCNKGKVKEFTEFFDTLRDKLTLGNAMQSTAQCSHLTQEEHHNVAQAFNLGIELGYYSKTQSAAAQAGGPEFYINCKVWDEKMGTDWFGTLVTHELRHASGYRHPKFKKQVYTSQCENIGSSYCAGHCMEWTRACENHAIFGSETCGFAGFGCKTRCVHSDYCFSLPERLTECFGYQKVHSRAESVEERTKGWLPEGMADSKNLMTLVMAGIVACCCLSSSCCLFACWRHRISHPHHFGVVATPVEQQPLEGAGEGLVEGAAIQDDEAS